MYVTGVVLDLWYLSNPTVLAKRLNGLLDDTSYGELQGLPAHNPNADDAIGGISSIFKATSFTRTQLAQCIGIEITTKLCDSIIQEAIDAFRRIVIQNKTDSDFSV